MSEVVVVNLKSRPDKYGEAVTFLQKHIPDTGSFEGCEVCHICGNPEDSTLMVYEEWESLECQKKYLQWRQGTGCTG